MDNLSKEKRSWNMAQITAANTKPEIKVRSILHRAGFRFRLHRKDLPGRPDIVLPKYNTAIFVHGCFWHRHFGCKFAYFPKSRIEFWKEKFEKTVKRDEFVQIELKKAGWRVIVVWECEIKSNDIESKLKSLILNRDDN